MRARGLSVAAALALCLAGAGAGPVRAADEHSCPRVRDIGPTGRDPADGWQIRTRVTTCLVARSVVRHYTGVAAMHPGDPIVNVGRYTCTNGYPRVRCTGPGERLIRFRNDG